MFNTHHIRKKYKRQNESHLLQQHGILRHEMFAMKNMDVLSNLLTLKLDMVYRNKSMEDSQARYSELTATVPVVETQTPPKPTRKAVKPVVRKSK